MLRDTRNATSISQASTSMSQASSSFQAGASSSSHDDCPICLESLFGHPSSSSSSLASGATPTFLPCSHAFHKACIDAIPGNKTKCPVCRTPFARGTAQTQSPSGPSAKTRRRRPFRDPNHFCTLCETKIAHGTLAQEVNARFGNPRTTLPCGHFFHHACIAGHVAKTGSCPRCRAPVAARDLPDIPASRVALPARGKAPHVCVTCYLPVKSASAVAVKACAERRHVSHAGCEKSRAAFRLPCNGCGPAPMQAVPSGACAVCKRPGDKHRALLPTNWPCGHVAHGHCASERLRGAWLCPACRGLSVHVAEKVIKGVCK